MKIDDIISKHCVEKITNTLRITPNYKKDFVQEIYLILLHDKKINDIEKEKQIYNYVYGICRNQWLSKTSSFYYKYKKNEEKNNTLDDDDSRIE